MIWLPYRAPVIAVLSLLVVACSVKTPVQHASDAGVLEPNLVEAGELAALPGATEAVASAIVQARPIVSAADLDAAVAPVLGPNERSKLYEKLFRKIDLNAATREEIMLIPGMSERMAHEFEEYRPYTSMEQFRREIGKYVDEAEVARLEQYVFLRVPLNSASRDLLMTIPGMSAHMAHEFEEYRPYTSMEQFRREIGKYVGEAELARLQSYVRLDADAD